MSEIKKEEINKQNGENEIDRRLKVMVEKINTMENCIKNERILRMKLEQENSELKESVSLIQKQVDKKDEIFKTLYIDKLNLEKELNEKAEAEKTDSIIMFKLKGKSNLKEESKSKVEYYKNLFENEKKKNEFIEKELLKVKKEFEDYREIEKEKNNILIQDSTSKENANFKLKSDLKSLSEANKNFLIEINSLNNIIDQLYKQQDLMSIELRFYENEYELVKKNLNETNSHLRRQDSDFTAISRKLNEFRSTLADIQVTNKIFNVTRIGRLYESNADIIFTQDEAKNYVINIKYMYTSKIIKILDIDDIFLRDENVVKIKYSPQLQLRNEKFKTLESQEIIKLYKEMKERAIGASNESKKIEESRLQLAQTNIKQMLEDIF